MAEYLIDREMIKSFKDKGAERVYSRAGSNRLPRDIQQTALRELRMINNSKTLKDLRIPLANRLAKLTGDREGSSA
jgi:proteic killer suppression protein